MSDIVYFVKDGLTYAKGFFNQNGFSFYVLKGHMDEFNKKLPVYLQEDQEYHVEELSELPGPSCCPEAP